MADNGGQPAISGYVTVQGRQVWHEVHGTTGDPVLLLHGGFAGASSWAAQAPALTAARVHVYPPEPRGDAHTAHVEGPPGLFQVGVRSVGQVSSGPLPRAGLV